MKFTISRDVLLKPLTLVAGAIERRQTMPILSNVLFRVKKNDLFLTGTDLEVELKGHVPCEVVQEEGDVTIPARRLLDICRTLPEETMMGFYLENQRLGLTCGRAKFSLQTLPAHEFPSIDEGAAYVEFNAPSHDLYHLLNQVHFSMALQDVRYFLNGILVEVDGHTTKAVATDGHRLALSQAISLNKSTGSANFIIPRKGVQEIMRLFPDDLREDITVSFSQHFLKVQSQNYSLISKLIDGRYPNYHSVIPIQNDQHIYVSKENFTQTLSCAAIFTNEKYRGVRIQIRPDVLRVITKSPDQEEAEQEIILNPHQGGDLDTAFNVTYLLDALNAIKNEEIKVSYSTQENTGLILENPNGEGGRYIIMPLLL